LWNESNYNQNSGPAVSSVVDKVSKIFTIVVVFIAVFSGLWYVILNELPTGLNAFTAVLIITCPCALALSYPFALGNAIRILGSNKLFLKNTHVIEKMSRITDIVFDKTGTLTKGGEAYVVYMGDHLSDEQKSSLCSLVSQSSHPLSRIISNYFDGCLKMKVEQFAESAGQGIVGRVNGVEYKVGSSVFAGMPADTGISSAKQSRVYWSENGTYMGFFAINNVYREGIGEVTGQLKEKYSLHLLSGDNDSEKQNLLKYFDSASKLHFNQAPADKLTFIKQLQQQGKKAIMLGDGLNDAGALKQSDCGIAVSDNVNNFSPACDGILDASVFKKFPQFLKFSRSSMKIIYASYAISFLYNCVGIWFAVQGNLSPLVAAVIMPLSTVTIILFTTLSTNVSAYFHRVK